MAAGIVVVGLILVGLPLLAWWLGGRRFWARTPAASAGDVYREMVLKHQLRPAEIAKVEGAVAWGRELTDERLRAAVVDWAQHLREDAARRRAAHPLRRRIMIGILVAWGTTVLVLAGVGVARGNWESLVRLVVYALAFGVPGMLAARGPRRAIERNSPRDASSRQNGPDGPISPGRAAT